VYMHGIDIRRRSTTTAYITVTEILHSSVHIHIFCIYSFFILGNEKE